MTDYRDLVIEDLADTCAALEDRAVDALRDALAYRDLLQGALAAWAVSEKRLARANERIQGFMGVTSAAQDDDC